MIKFHTIFKLNLMMLTVFLIGCQQQQTALILPYTPNSSFNHENKKIVLVGGCFDILHYGHIQFLQKAKNQGNYLIVALEPDEKIINQKHRMPIHTQRIRAQNLASLRSVDEILLLPVLKGYEDYQILVERIGPKIIAVTQGDPQLNNKIKQADEIGAHVIVVTEKQPNLSTSLILEKCIEMQKL